ncbi:cation:proton antiporter [Candidatus Woesearchaeota archaeon]|nr:cation:proton antiporter [Candidatus Woesearchaeota archaeon]
MVGNEFIVLSLILIIAVVVSLVMRLLKQPLIIGYIITGIIVSRYLIPESALSIATFAEIGVALLLFLVGLNLNPKMVKEVGKVSIITGIGQVLFTSLIGFFIARYFGFSITESVYISVALTFSSTIIIMKLLSDKNDLETLYGRIAIGFLIVQDLIAIFILMAISSLSSGADFTSMALQTVLKGAGLSIAVFVAGIYMLPKLTKAVARSQEFLLLFSITWSLAVASLFLYFSFSIEIGALLAGITLSLSPYRYEISSRMRPLRDFFIVMFFVLIGTQVVFSDISQYIYPIIAFSAFVLIGNPLIVMILMGLLGYTKKNSFRAGLTVAQISEFSLILIALGVKLGHLPLEILSLVTAVGIITITGTTYFITYGNRIYPYLSRYLSIFERKGKKVDEHAYHKDKAYDIILFGHNRIGYDLLESFKKLRKKFLVVDYNPEIVINLAKEGVDCKYGDASDSELLNELNLNKAKAVISTIPDIDTNLLLINKIKESNGKAIIIVVAHRIEDALKVYEEGATYVIMPHFLGGKHASVLLEKYGFNINKFLKEKIMHLEHLKRRKDLGHEHPTHDY